jgi:hypothetical protein
MLLLNGNQRIIVVNIPGTYKTTLTTKNAGQQMRCPA